LPRTTLDRANWKNQRRHYTPIRFPLCASTDQSNPITNPSNATCARTVLWRVVPTCQLLAKVDRRLRQANPLRRTVLLPGRATRARAIRYGLHSSGVVTTTLARANQACGLDPSWLESSRVGRASCESSRVELDSRRRGEGRGESSRVRCLHTLHKAIVVRIDVLLPAARSRRWRCDVNNQLR